MKTYNQFISEAPSDEEAAKIAPGMSPEKRRAALERNARNQARRSTPSGPASPKPGQKKLPPGRSGAIQKRPSSAIKRRTDGSIVKSNKDSSALAKRGEVTPTSPKRTVMSNSGDEKQNVGKRTDMPKIVTPDEKMKKKKKTLLSQANKARKNVFKKYRQAKQISQGIFNAPGSTKDSGGSASVGSSTTKDRG